jgi:hypothetical protein
MPKIHPTNNFELAMKDIKQALGRVKQQFESVAEFCGHRDGYEYCKHPDNRMTHANTYCKMEFCPFLR